jgi:general transcription factor 3C polypeptide 3 (transcription factor C subunit 4)
MKLAEIYEIMNHPRKALDLVYEVIESRKKRHKNSNAAQPEEPGGLSTSTSLFTEERAAAKGKSSTRQNRPTLAQLKELEAEKEKEVVRGHRRLTELWGGMLAGDENADREWMLETERLVDMFRETRNLFLTTRVSFFNFYFEPRSGTHVEQSNPFRGMFPRSRMKKRQGTEADEDNMASRLQLDLGACSKLLMGLFLIGSLRKGQFSQKIV